MNKINVNKLSGIQIKKLNDAKPQTLEEVVIKYFNKLAERAEREVPEYGDFKSVEETFKNPDNNYYATDFNVKIISPPLKIPDYKKLRGIVISAYKDSSPYKIESLFAVGTKNEIMQKFKSSEFLEKFINKVKSISENLRDV